VEIKGETAGDAIKSEGLAENLSQDAPVKSPGPEEKKPVIPMSQPIQPRPKTFIDSCSLGLAIDHSLDELSANFTPLEDR